MRSDNIQRYSRSLGYDMVCGFWSTVGHTVVILETVFIIGNVSKNENVSVFGKNVSSQKWGMKSAFFCQRCGRSEDLYTQFLEQVLSIVSIFYLLLLKIITFLKMILRYHSKWYMSRTVFYPADTLMTGSLVPCLPIQSQSTRVIYFPHSDSHWLKG